jgi:tetratricopeptide (TPR) repeat protein
MILLRALLLSLVWAALTAPGFAAQTEFQSALDEAVRLGALEAGERLPDPEVLESTIAALVADDQIDAAIALADAAVTDPGAIAAGLASPTVYEPVMAEIFRPDDYDDAAVLAFDVSVRQLIAAHLFGAGERALLYDLRYIRTSESYFEFDLSPDPILAAFGVLEIKYDILPVWTGNYDYAPGDPFDFSISHMGGYLFEEAYESAVLEHGETSVEAREALCRWAEALGAAYSLEEAERLLTEAFTAPLDAQQEATPRCRLAEARVALASGQVDRASNAVVSGLGHGVRGPAADWLNVTLIDVHVRRSAPDGALDVWAALSGRLSPETDFPLWWRGEYAAARAHLALGEWDEAHAALERIMERADRFEDLGLWVERGNVVIQYASVLAQFAMLEEAAVAAGLGLRIVSPDPVGVRTDEGVAFLLESLLVWDSRSEDCDPTLDPIQLVHGGGILGGAEVVNRLPQTHPARIAAAYHVSRVQLELYLCSDGVPSEADFFFEGAIGWNQRPHEYSREALEIALTAPERLNQSPTLLPDPGVSDLATLHVEQLWHAPALSAALE